MKALTMKEIRKEAQRLTPNKELQKVIELAMIWASSQTIKKNN